MKKKILFLAGLCVLGLCTWEAQAENAESIPINNTGKADPPQGFEVIVLKGTLMYGINPNAIVAGASEDAVYIGFNQSFGNVNISIYNGMGSLVYTTEMNTNVQLAIIIPFSTAANGSYTVELSNTEGSAEGDFDRQSH